MTILVISGKSLSGKTTLAQTLIAEHGFKRVITTTSRPPRAGEVDGVDYHFTDRESFLALADSGAMIEMELFDGNFYGLSFKSVLNHIDNGNHAVLIVEPNGHKKIANYLKGIDAPFVSTFLNCSVDTLTERFFARLSGELAANPEDAETIIAVNQKRFANMLQSEGHWTPDGSHDQPKYHIVFDKQSKGITDVLVNHCNKARLATT